MNENKKRATSPVVEQQSEAAAKKPRLDSLEGSGPISSDHQSTVPQPSLRLTPQDVMGATMQKVEPRPKIVGAFEAINTYLQKVGDSVAEAYGVVTQQWESDTASQKLQMNASEQGTLCPEVGFDNHDKGSQTHEEHVQLSQLRDQLQQERDSLQLEREGLIKERHQKNERLAQALNELKETKTELERIRSRWQATVAMVKLQTQRPTSDTSEEDISKAWDSLQYNIENLVSQVLVGKPFLKATTGHAKKVFARMSAQSDDYLRDSDFKQHFMMGAIWHMIIEELLRSPLIVFQNSAGKLMLDLETPADGRFIAASILKAHLTNEQTSKEINCNDSIRGAPRPGRY
jgi:hypothetical protein